MGCDVLTENIPDYMKDRHQWVLWKSETLPSSKRTRVPYQPSGYKAKSNDPTTWSSLQSCTDALSTGRFDGIGFAFAQGDGLTGIDLDHCINADGTLEPWAKKIVEQFAGTYIERSPSGDGLHIWCFGVPLETGENKWDKPGLSNKQGIEIYDYTSPRYLTVTGDIFQLDKGILNADACRTDAP